MVRLVLRRWFVEYNPLYILSAALVLRGVNLLSHALTAAGHVYAQLGVPAIVELYAWALIAGAAVLLRVGLKRPALMLSMLAIVYQADLTLHTETCAYLGAAGSFAAIVWLASFVLKLFALARAMRLRVSRSAFAVPTFAAAGLVIVPRLVQHADARGGSTIAAGFLFALFAAGLWTSRRIESKDALGAWGHTVFHRAKLAAWAIWSSLAVLHVLFLFSQRAMDPTVLLPIPLLLATRFMPREAFAWATVLATLVVVAVISPQFVAFTALLAAIILVARAITTRSRAAALLVGALFSVHFAVWTASWTGGAFPPHVLALDGALGALVALSAWKLRVRAALAPFAAIVLHHAIQTRIVTAPITSLEWGAWSVGAGFVLLLATIATSVALHLKPQPDPVPIAPASR